MGFGITELLIILAIALVFFGGKRLKNLGGDLGGAIKGFKKSMKDDTSEEKAEDIIEVKAEKEETGK